MSHDRIEKDRVVTLKYRMTDGGGEEFDSSDDSGPIQYLHGHDQILPGLERGLEGRRSGDELSVNVAAADGFGDHDEELVISVPRDRFEFAPEVGSVVAAQHPDGRVQHLQVVGVADESITLDGNHPLAGRDLVFEVTVEDVRQATEEELAHGHSHGEDGHHSH